jgi:hypothetical protein
MASLADPYLKLNRARMHLERLQALTERFVSTDPCIFTREDDVENNLHILSARMRDVPDEIPLTVGDAFYNLRSSLDQLVWSLAKGPGNILDPQNTQFPIIGVNDQANVKRFASQTRGVPKLAIREIETIQPYHRASSYKAHPLWRLNTMCNLDKHRRIPANGSEAQVFLPNATAESVQMSSSEDKLTVSVPLIEKKRLDLSPTFFFKINFGGNVDGFSEDLDGLWEIFNFVGETVLPRFARFFTQQFRKD